MGEPDEKNEIVNATVANDESTEQGDSEETWGDRLLKEGDLSPRHRRLAELLAQGKLSNNEIAEQMGYTPSRVSILKSNTRIREEVERVRERIYQDGVGTWIKKMTEPAQREIERCLLDRTNRYKEQIKVDTAKWLLEMNHGKAKQTHDIGENILGVFMDRLDALKGTGARITPGGIIDVTPLAAPQGSGETIEPTEAEKKDPMLEWVDDFAAENKD